MVLPTRSCEVPMPGPLDWGSGDSLGVPMKFLAKLGLMAIEIIVAYVVSFACVILGFALLGKIVDAWENRGEKTRDQKVEEVEAEPVQDGEILSEDK